MKKFTPLQNFGLLLLRISFSASMLTHGIPKLEKLMAGGEIKFPDPMGIGSTASLVLAVIGEVLAPALIIIGLKTRFAAIPAAITMAVAFFVVHGTDPFGDKEMSFVYLAAFAAIACLGAGKISLDGALQRSR